MRSQCSLISAHLRGVEAIPVTVEVVICSGMPGISIVGMADTAVQEVRERMRAAIRSAGFEMPNKRIIINLAPSSMKKSGSAFDLPIVLGVLAATSQISLDLLKGKLFIGELSLEGGIRAVAGILSYGVCAKKLGISLVSSGTQAVPIEGLTHYGLASLINLHTEKPFQTIPCKLAEQNTRPRADEEDFSDIAGHDVAKRALQIAALGRHGVLMMGPPGSGKTMLASRLGTIMPPLSQDEMLETAMVHSIAGENVNPILGGKRPFRSPHHSATTAGLIGGGSPIRPGEASLAHCGALFLDELPEFKPSVLQSLRQPMESGKICLTRAEGNIVFPAKFMFIAAANPCPCGYLGDKDHQCRCTALQVRKYQGKIGGPLLDRIDIQLNVERLPPASVLKSSKGTSSKKLRDKVMQALEFRNWRAAFTLSDADKDRDKNYSAQRAKKSSKEIIEACSLSQVAQDYILEMAESYKLSGRALINTLNVGRTIADLEESDAVGEDHLAEALSLRLQDGIGEY